MNSTAKKKPNLKKITHEEIFLHLCRLASDAVGSMPPKLAKTIFDNFFDGNRITLRMKLNKHRRMVARWSSEAREAAELLEELNRLEKKLNRRNAREAICPAE